MTDDDAEKVREVNALSGATLRSVYRPSRDTVARNAKRKRNLTQFVCVKDGSTVATAGYEVDEDRLHIKGPMVIPAHRRQGVARSMIEYLVEIGRQKGMRALSLNTIKQTGNVYVFAKLGFVALRESPDLLCASVSGEELADVYMERELPQNGF